MELLCGTSGWAYPSWKPGFYPEGLAQSRFLEYYSQRLNSVEVNYTFRHRLLHSTAEKWITAAPADFKFSFKAHQTITHFRRLKNIDEPLEGFLDSVKPFRQVKRLGVVLFQLPENMKCDLETMGAFLRVLPKGWRFALEFRHASWLQEEVLRLLRREKVALCLTRGREELAIPTVRTADFLYYRLRGEFRAYKPVRLLDEIGSFKPKAAYVYFKHEETPTGALRARRLLQLVGKSGAESGTKRDTYIRSDNK